MNNTITRDNFNNANETCFITYHSKQHLEHKHDFYEYIYVIEGSCTINISGIHIILQQDEFILINKFVTYNIIKTSPNLKYTSVGHVNMLFLNLTSISTYKLKIQRMAELFVLENWNYRIFKSNSPEIASTFKDIYSIINNNLDMKDLLIQLKLMEFTVLFLEDDSMTKYLPNSSSNVITYIGENLASSTLKEFAKLNHISVSKASHDIQEIYQMNFLEIKHEIQIQESVRLLENPNISIEQILDHIGIVNKTHFYKLFKSAHGTTPKKYRDNYLNTPKKDI